MSELRTPGYLTESDPSQSDDVWLSSQAALQTRNPASYNYNNNNNNNHHRYHHDQMILIIIITLLLLTNNNNTNNKKYLYFVFNYNSNNDIQYINT